MQNPNWPTLSVKTWPVNPPPDGSLPTSASTDLVGKSRAIKITRGRQYELDQDQAGTGTVTVDNSTGALTAGAGGNLPMRPCQITATWAGTTYPLFTGYVERWPTQSDNPSRATSTLALVDLFAALTQRTVRSAMTESVLALNPSYYWPLDDLVGSSAAGNIAQLSQGTSTSLALKYNPAAVSPTTGLSNGGFGATGILTSDGTTSFKVSGKSSPQGNEGLTTRLNQVGAPSFDTTQPWAIAFVVGIDSGAVNTADQAPIFTFYDAGGNGAMVAYIQYGSGNAQVNFVGSQGPGGYTVTIAGAAATGPTAVVFGYDGTNFFCQSTAGVLGINSTFGVSSTPATFYVDYPAFLSIGYPWNALGSGDIGTGKTWTAASVNDQYISHLAIWTNGNFPGTTALQGYAAAAAGFPGETASARATRVLSWLGISHLNFDTTSNPLGQCSIGPTDAMADVLRQIALDDLARIFIGADGTVVLQNRNHGQQTLTTPPAIGSNIAGGEVPYTVPPVIDFDPTRIFNDVQVQQIAGATQRSQDTTSQASYFQRVLQLQVNQQNAVDALYCSQWLLGRYKQPTARVEAVTIDIGQNPGWHPTILGLELGQTVVLNHRTITAATQSLLCHVDQITHDIKDGTSWVVTLQLSPVLVQYGLIPGMRTTFAAAAGAGVSAISLAPLADSALNAAEWSLPVGTVLVLDGANASVRETVTVRSVTSQPTANTPGYSTVTVQLVSPTVKAHAVGGTCWEQPAAIEGTPWNDPADWAARGVLESTFRLTW